MIMTKGSLFFCNVSTLPGTSIFSRDFWTLAWYGRSCCSWFSGTCMRSVNMWLINDSWFFLICTFALALIIHRVVLVDISVHCSQLIYGLNLTKWWAQQSQFWWYLHSHNFILVHCNLQGLKRLFEICSSTPACQARSPILTQQSNYVPTTRTSSCV